jgi:hypothetical protein
MMTGGPQFLSQPCPNDRAVNSTTQFHDTHVQDSKWHRKAVRNVASGNDDEKEVPESKEIHVSDAKISLALCAAYPHTHTTNCLSVSRHKNRLART